MVLAYSEATGETDGSIMAAIAISPMMTNVFSVAKTPPATVTTSQMARIAPRIVPMTPAHVPGMRPAFLAGGSRAGPSRPGPWGRLACLAGTAPGHRRSQPRSAPGAW